LLDLSESIPPGLIPRTTADKLAQYGKSEIVSVIFPLQGRSGATVSDEIKPLLSTYGKAVPLPGSGQLLVTDTAETLKAVGAVIEKLPVPPPTAIPVAGETATVAVYPIKTGDPPTALKVLQALMPTATFALDPQTDQIHAQATPTQQALVKSVLEQIQSNAPADKKPLLETYPVEDHAAAQLVKTLTSLLPTTATVSHDPKTGRLVAWASPADHKNIQKVLEKLGVAGVAEQTRQFEVYRLTKADPTTTLTLLQELFPAAKIALEKTSGSLAVVGSATDHKGIKAILEQLQPDKPGPGAPELKAYPVATTDPSGTLKTLKTLYPNAQIALDATSERFLVTAPPVEQTAIRASLDQIQTPAPPEKKARFETYLLRGVDPTTLLTNLQTLVPTAKVTVDKTGVGKLVVFGTPAEHETVKAALDTLGRGAGVESTPQLEIHRLTKADPTTTIATLQSVAPEAKITLDPQSKSLIVLAVPADQKAIRTVLEQLQPDKPAPDAPQLRFFPLPQPPSEGTLGVLKALAPKAQITYDTAARRLTIVASPEDQATLQAAILQVEQAAQAEEKNKLVAYTVSPTQQKRFRAVATALTTELPGIQVLPQTDPNEVVAWARPSQHVVIAQLLEQLRHDVPFGEKFQLTAYPLRAADPTTIVTMLQTAVPNAQITLDARARRLLIWAAPADHERIKQALDKIEGGPQPADGAAQETLRVYPVQGIDAATALKTVKEALPADVRLSTDAAATTILAWAMPWEHETITRVLTQLQEGAGKPTLVVYPVVAGDPTSVMTVIKALVPRAALTVDATTRSIAASATSQDHELIRSAVDQLGKGEAPAVARKIVVYPFKAAGRNSRIYTLTLLRTLFPEAVFSMGAETDQLVVLARPQEHAAIKTAVEQVSQPDAPEIARKLVPYALTEAGPTGVSTAITTLTTMFPDATFTAGVQPGQILAWARPADHQQITKVVQDLSQQEPPEQARKIVVHAFKGATSTAAYYTVAMLRTLFPEATFSTGADPDKLIVLARPKDHEAIKGTLEQLTQADPPETARRITVYTVEASGAANATGAITTLTAMFPEAKFSAGLEPGQLIAWARPAEHTQIAKAIEDMSKKEPPEKARKVVVYAFKGATAATAYYTLTMLRGLFPEATFSTGAEPDKLIVLARPKDHEAIKGTLEQIAQADPPETARRITVYTVEASGAANATGAITTLTGMFPEAKFSAGLEPGQLIAWARPAEHTEIAKAIEDMSKREPREKARKVVVYPFKAVNPTAGYYTIAMLRTLFPEAQFSVGAEPDKLVVLARPKEHDAIKSTVEQLTQPDPPDVARRITVYTLESSGATSATGAITTLTTMFPEAKISAGNESGQILVWARPAEHQQIAQAIQDMSQKEPPEKAPRMASYTLEGGGAYGLSYAVTVLRNAFPDAKFSVGSNPNQLFAWARPADQEAIQKAIAEISKGGKPTAQVYRFEWADPRAAYTALTTLVPNAAIALDISGRSLVVTATAEDHAKIKATVTEMDRRDLKDVPRLEVYRFKLTDPATMLPVLQGLFRNQPQVQLSLDDRLGTIVAMATPVQHETIRALVEQVEREGAAEAGARVQIYPLGDRDPAATLRAITALMDKQGAKAQLTIEPRSNSLVAIAQPEQHNIITAVLDQLKPEDRTMEILQLDVLDPETAELAITRLFANEPFANSPSVDVDAASQQMFVLATGRQHEKIRELLMKMGETGLAQAGGGARFRVFPFDGDLEGAVEEIKRIWPQLRANPIEVVESLPEVLIRQRQAKPESGPEPPPSDKPGKPTPPQPDAPPAPPQKPADKPAPTPNPADKPQPADKLKPADPPPDSPPQPGSGAADAKDPAAKSEAANRPITVVPGDGTVTITSDDPGALRQFELLLRAMSRHRSIVGRNYAVFQLRNAKAAQVAATLQQMFRTLPRTGSDTSQTPGQSRWSRATPVVIVPDERMNAIVAYGSRTDRAAIEGLLKVLDSAELPESQVAQRLQIIPLENAEAATILAHLKTLFPSQVDALSIEEATNSLIVVAPPQTRKEIERVVGVLDEAAGGDSGRVIEILPLSRIGSDRMDTILQAILKGQPATKKPIPRLRQP
jgi:type II secretory pathway component GspD/PulD (secretin)